MIKLNVHHFLLIIYIRNEKAYDSNECSSNYWFIYFFGEGNLQFLYGQTYMYLQTWCGNRSLKYPGDTFSCTTLQPQYTTHSTEPHLTQLNLQSLLIHNQMKGLGE